MADITQKRLKESLIYVPESGAFVWKATLMPAGAPRDKRGYIRIGIEGKRYHAHRLAFIYMTGACPKYIDHIDGRMGNNAWENLRGATKSQNGMNRAAPKNNTSGVKGVSFHQNAFVAEVRVDGEKHYLGRFSTLDDATEAVTSARQKLHGEFAHG